MMHEELDSVIWLTLIAMVSAVLLVGTLAGGL
jgi:hypothetical protein